MADVLMIDATHDNVHNVPETAPKVAGYVTGTPDIKWVDADAARFHGSKVRIDQSPGHAVFAAGGADVADVEAGAGTIQDAVAAVLERQRHGRYSTIYIAEGQLAALKEELTKAGAHMNKVGFWVANWNLSLSEASARLGNEIVAIQFASPSSNPGTFVPGTNMTLREANVDLSITEAGWFPPPAAPPAWQSVALRYAQGIKDALAELEDILRAHQ